jgi:hypothetical protein
MYLYIMMLQIKTLVLKKLMLDIWHMAYFSYQHVNDHHR